MEVVLPDPFLERLNQLVLSRQSLTSHPRPHGVDKPHGSRHADIGLQQQSLNIIPTLIVYLRRTKSLRNAPKERLAGASKSIT